MACRRAFEMVIDNVGSAIWWKDVDGVYLGCNRAAAEFAGFAEPGEMVGKTDADCAWGAEGLHDGGVEWFRAHDRQVIRSGEPLLGIRERAFDAEGKVRWGETNKVPLIDNDGTVIGTLGIFTDVTERARAEEELLITLDDLDARVRRRTTELKATNDRLRAEIDERSRLEKRERARRARAESLRELASAIAGSLQVDEVVDRTLVGIETLVECDRASIVLTGATGLEVAGTRGGGATDARGTLGGIDDRLGELVAEPLAGPQVVDDGVVVAPLTVSGTRLGFMVVESTSRALHDDAIGLISTVADQASSAISNCRALDAARSLAAIEERQRVANDLHDSVSQTLWTAQLAAERLAKSADLPAELSERANRLRVLTTGALAEMRTLLMELRPEVIEGTPLEELLGQLVRGFSSRKHATCELDIEPAPEPEPAVREALYRIVQESLNNVVRHARATAVAVRLRVTGGDLVLEITDDGLGFDSGSRPDHLGLRIMAERAEAVGGVLVVESAPGAGTTVTVTIAGAAGTAP